jgi:hypothetical protein
MYFIALLIPNETSEYQIQLQRSEFILSKLIDRVPDEIDEGSEKAALLNEQEGGGGEDEEDEAMGFGDHGVELPSHVILQSNPMLQSQSPALTSSRSPSQANEV